MQVLLWTSYHLWRNRPMPEQRLCGPQWNRNRRWWRMTTGIADSIAVIMYDLLAV